MISVEKGYIGIGGVGEQSVLNDNHLIGRSPLSRQSLQVATVCTLISIVDVIADDKMQTRDVADTRQP